MSNPAETKPEVKPLVFEGRARVVGIALGKGKLRESALSVHLVGTGVDVTVELPAPAGASSPEELPPSPGIGEAVLVTVRRTGMAGSSSSGFSPTLGSGEAVLVTVRRT